LALALTLENREDAPLLHLSSLLRLAIAPQPAGVLPLGVGQLLRSVATLGHGEFRSWDRLLPLSVLVQTLHEEHHLGSSLLTFF